MNKSTENASRPGYFENVEAYQLVHSWLEMMFTEGDFAGESKRTQKQLRSIQKSMTTGIVRNTAKAYTKPHKKASPASKPLRRRNRQGMNNNG